jgi:hypothetical protein
MEAAKGRNLDIRVYWRACMLNMASLVRSRTAQFALQSPEFDTQQQSLGKTSMRIIRLSKPRTRLQQHYIARWVLRLSGQHLAELANNTI